MASVVVAVSTVDGSVLVDSVTVVDSPVMTISSVCPNVVTLSTVVSPVMVISSVMLGVVVVSDTAVLVSVDISLVGPTSLLVVLSVDPDDTVTVNSPPVDSSVGASDVIVVDPVVAGCELSTTSPSIVIVTKYGPVNDELIIINNVPSPPINTL